MKRNHEFDHLFESREIVMKKKPKANKDDSESDDDEAVDDYPCRCFV